MRFLKLFEADTSISGVLNRRAKEEGIYSSSTRHSPHVRLKCPNGQYEETLSRILPVKFSCRDSELRFSATYQTFIVTLDEPFEEFPAGTEFYYVPTSRKLVNPMALISDKQLTPERVLGPKLGQPFTQAELKEYVESRLDNREVFPESDSDFRFVEYFMKGMMNIAVDGTNYKIKSGEKLDKGDITRILKDFGEIACALRAFNEFPETVYVQFPTKSNEKMVDFWCLNENLEKVRYISVKSGTAGQIGAAPSMKNIRDFADDFRDSEYKELFEIFTDERPVIQKILDAAGVLDPEIIKLIRKVIKKPVTVENISEFCRKHLGELKEKFGEFYSYIGRDFSDDSIGKVESKNLKTYSGFVLSPLGYFVMDTINRNKGFIDFLSNVIRKLQIIQANIVYKGNLSFEFKELQTAEFKFDFHNNALLPGNNNFGFKVIKSKR